MALTMGDKIMIIMKRRQLTITQLAAKTNQSRTNLSNKLKRDNFQEQELRAIAEALDCDFEASFVMRDTGERI